MAEESLSIHENLLNFAKKIAEEQNFKSFDTKITPVSTHGANYTSTLYKIKITGDGRDLDLFAKVAALNEKIRIVTKFNPFNIESEFYTDLVKIYRQIEDKNGVSNEDKLKIPAFYGVDMTYLKEILVLEDLTSRGFGSPNRFESVDWSYASAAITELAKFHALSVAFQYEHPSEFEAFANKIPGYNFDENPENTGVEQIFKTSVASALAAVRDENKDKLSAFLNSLDTTKSFSDMYKTVHCKVITHTDFRPNNMLHKAMDDGSTEVIPVDYQTLQPGSPILDLLYFIFTATDGPFRAKYYQQLIDHYYSELSITLARLGIDIALVLSRKNFDSELREKLPFGLMMSISILPILVVPEDKAPVMGDDFSSMAVNATSDLYVQRINEVVDDYVRWQVLDSDTTKNVPPTIVEEKVSTEEQLLKFLKKIAEEQNFKKFDIHITPVSTHGANYTSTLYKVKISGDGRDLALFAKVAALSEKIRADTTFNPFNVENEFYTNLTKSYKQIEEKNEVSDKDKLKYPMFYGIDETYLREILVLEDLTSKGFGSPNRFKSVDWSYACAAITELAKFHALSIAFEHESPSEFEAFVTNKLPAYIYEDNPAMEQVFQASGASALAVVREENKDSLSIFFNSLNATESLKELYKPINCKVITHTDFRPNNMLHKVVNDGSTEVVPVDYQTLQPGSPVIDLLYFIFTATDGSFRAKHYQELIDHYYSELGVSLGRLGIDIALILSRKEFDCELQEKLPYGLIMSVALLPVLVVPEDEAPVIGDDFSSFAVNATSDTYAQRLNDVVDEYVKWGILKEKDNPSQSNLEAVPIKTVSNEEHLLNFVNKIAEELNFKNVDIKIMPVSTYGANYTSTLFKIKITGGDKALHLFAKVSALNEKVREQTKTNPFEIESEFYINLSKTYNKLEEKNGISDNDKVNFPIFYGADKTYLQEILVLEDLTSRGFGLANRFVSVDWSYASAAITELAKFHALSIAFQHEYPEEFESYVKKIPGFATEEDVGMLHVFKQGIASALAAVRVENRDKLNEFLNTYLSANILESFADIFKPVNCKVIIHMDFRPSNMLHKMQNDGRTEVIPVDYQTLQIGSPVIDLIYFVVTATDGPFRDRYYQQLIDHYYSELGAALSRFRLNIADIFSRKDFDSELKEKLPIGLVTITWLLPVLLVPEDKAPVIGDDISNFAVNATSELYTQRLNEIVDDYVKWGVLGSPEINSNRSILKTEETSEPKAEETLSSDEHLIKFVNKIANEQKFNSFDVKITPVSTNGANYTSTLFEVKITGEGKELNLFAKVAALNEKIRSEANFNPFDVEFMFYTNLIKTYRLLEKKHGVLEKDRSKFPIYYGAETTHLQEILVLEDLTSRGFGSANRFKSVDWSYASAAITELAKFHALSIAFQHESPKDFEKFVKSIPGRAFENNPALGPFFEAGSAAALSAVRKENKDKLNVFIKSQDIMELFIESYKPVYCKVITHTDFRPNNMLHKILKDGSTEVIPVDYQTLQPGSPVIDLLYFIFTATDGPFRARYYQKLVNHYYAELGVALARLGLNVAHKFSRKDFETELREKLPYGLVMMIGFLPILVVPEDKAPVIGDDVSSFMVNTTSELYAQRLNEVVDDYANWGVLGNKNNSCFGRCLFGKR